MKYEILLKIGVCYPNSSTIVAKMASHRIEESDELQKSVEQQQTSPSSPPLKQFIVSCS
ncbi:unnamed protein product [Haemonchus placei]|uniref:Ovule protein n=1 Tax=Haemonchus placei TaxID=6290 RepID=A0A0N4XB93_HAEPC|nr:unnamed protein product [Haemonchus placei]